MVASRIYNKHQNRGSTETIHGAVTTGTIWKFLRLKGSTIAIDQADYYLDRLGKILGILLACVGGGPR